MYLFISFYPKDLLVTFWYSKHPRCKLFVAEHLDFFIINIICVFHIYSFNLCCKDKAILANLQTFTSFSLPLS